jgi:phage terminase large subunit-like protein
LDIEATIEEDLRELHHRNNVKEILCDPYQLHRSITTLKNAGLRIREFPQTTGNTTLMGQTLFDLLNGRNLRIYPAVDLRQQALNTVAVENPRGWRIAKEKTSKKIDSIVALSMACVAAIEGKPKTYSPGAVPQGVGDKTVVAEFAKRFGTTIDKNIDGIPLAEIDYRGAYHGVTRFNFFGGEKE